MKSGTCVLLQAVSYIVVTFQTEADCDYLKIINARELSHQIISAVNFLSESHKTFRRMYQYRCSSDVAKDSDCTIEHR